MKFITRNLKNFVNKKWPKNWKVAEPKTKKPEREKQNVVQIVLKHKSREFTLDTRTGELLLCYYCCRRFYFCVLKIIFLVKSQNEFVFVWVGNCSFSARIMRRLLKRYKFQILAEQILVCCGRWYWVSLMSFVGGQPNNVVY